MSVVSVMSRKIIVHTPMFQELSTYSPSISRQWKTEIRLSNRKKNNRSTGFPLNAAVWDCLGHNRRS
ncbi:unnamed protein product [Linum trigynum]|uniref:Uncharacterized protein n=1 Tax=Linum trigynum TaxID=586398 RepID=A0AAV2GVH4_9ROSI